MAEAKRQNAAGKVPVATPNVAAVSLETALGAAIGARIRLITNAPFLPTLEGSLFTVCPFTNLLAIATSPPNIVHHILPISAVQHFTILAPQPPSSSGPLTAASLTISPLQTAALLSRAEAAVARLKEAAARKNPSASKEAQEIFDAISRTLPTKWAGTSILVNETVVIASPYRAENCKAVPGQQPGALARVKMV
ncbi:hypothetical protein MMC31_004262, partial [Peltigera leucophlebia]|nr:hypothetical protein [Peltigera leucophlebia]